MSEASALKLDDFEAVKSAVAETERGRWFLAEMERRYRNSDIQKILGELERMQRAIAGEPATAEPVVVAPELAPVSEAGTMTDDHSSAASNDALASILALLTALRTPRARSVPTQLIGILEGNLDVTLHAATSLLTSLANIQSAAMALADDDEVRGKIEKAIGEIERACEFSEVIEKKTQAAADLVEKLDECLDKLEAICRETLPKHVESPPIADMNEQGNEALAESESA